MDARNSMRTIYLIGWVFGLGTLVASGCLWDKDTLIDELAVKPKVYDVVMGQFPSHGTAYYKAREKKLQAGQQLNREERNDLAVAKIRLGKFAEGRAILLALLAEDNRHYETLSNLGVLAKKEGKFGASAEYFRKALAIKPEGHMGLGDWYLKRVEFDRDLAKTPGGVPTTNFLGEPYISNRSRYPSAAESNQRLALLTKLIQNDRHFADGYLVLGDVLEDLGDLHLAMRAYQHAKHLKHPNPKVLRNRILKAARGRRALIPCMAASTARRQFKSALTKSNAWLKNFHQVEARQVRQGTFPSLNETKALQKMKAPFPLVPLNRRGEFDSR